MGKPASKDLIEHGIYRTKSNDIYDIRVQRTINGKQFHRRRSSINGIMTARKIRRQLEDDLGKLELQIQGGDIPFGDALEMYLTYLQDRINNNNGGAVSLATFTDRRDTLRKYSDVLLKTNITDISRSKIEAIVRGDYHFEIKSLTTERKKKILSFYRQCFEYHLLEFGRIKINPATGIYFKNTKPLDPPLIMTVPEIEKLLAYVKEQDFYWYSVYMIAIHLGLRAGEIYGLKWSDVDFERKQITVNRAFESKTGEMKSPKNGKPRQVPLNSTIQAFLQELKLKSNGEFIFDRTNVWEKGEQKKILNRFQVELKMPKTKFHSLRAFFITHLLRTGCSAVYVREIVSHSDLKTTMRYIALAGSELAGKTDALETIGRSHVASLAFLDDERKKREEKK